MRDIIEINWRIPCQRRVWQLNLRRKPHPIRHRYPKLFDALHAT
jgi:hypothetical protein